MEEMNQLKVFTAEEVNRLIPKLSEMIRELQGQRDLILRQEVEIDTLELVEGERQASHSPAMNRKLEEYNRTLHAFYDLIDKMHEMGCLLKDVDLGLVDFYTLYQGRVVYLCWKMGEKEIRNWHEVGLGYAYRQPLILEREEGRESSG